MDAEGSRRRERKELEERSEQVKVEKETKKRGKIRFKKGEEEIRRSGEKAKGECKEEGSKVLQVFEGMKKGGKKRDRNVIWRRVERENEEERRWLIEEIMRKSLRRKLGIRGVEERKGKGGRWVLIVELEELRQRRGAEKRGGDRKTVEDGDRRGYVDGGEKEKMENDGGSEKRESKGEKDGIE